MIICLKPVRPELVFPYEHRNEKFLVNPYDMKALELAVKLKKMSQNSKITCIIMGPESSKEVIEYALSLGADEGILISDVVFSGSDTVATSFIISRAIEKLGGADLILCGEKSVDGETGQVAFGISERIGYNCISGICDIDAVYEDSINAIRRDEKKVCRISIKQKAVLITKDCVTSYPSPSLIMRKKAKQKEINIFDHNILEILPSECGLKGSKTMVSASSKIIPQVTSSDIIGNASEKADKILELLGI